MAAVSEYEHERQRRIARNKRKLEDLGVMQAGQDLEASLAARLAPSRVKAKSFRELIVRELEPRRSRRDMPKVNYFEADEPPLTSQRGINKLTRKIIQIKREDLHPSLIRLVKSVSSFDSGKGVRIQGGRVYDSKLGVTCHWCRQKTLENKVTCTSASCGGGRRLPTSFCKMCLKNRHGEDVIEAETSQNWICPCCRVSCGRGCTCCCNCGPCRKKAGLSCTHQIIKSAREAGFNNAHDYLVHQSTGESAEEIAARKFNAAWGEWLTARPLANNTGASPSPGRSSQEGEAPDSLNGDNTNSEADEENDAWEAQGTAGAGQATISSVFVTVKADAHILVDKVVDSVRQTRRATKRAMQAIGLEQRKAEV